MQRSRQTVPLGNLQGVRERWLSLEGLLIKKAFDGVVGQLFHDNKCFIKVQQHGEVVILPMSQDMDALSQYNVRGFLQPPDLVPGDDQLHCKVITMNENKIRVKSQSCKDKGFEQRGKSVLLCLCNSVFFLSNKVQFLIS